jgi:cytochrome P450
VATQPAQIADPYTLPLDKLDPSDPMLFHTNEHWPMFKRLREEDPVHYVEDSVGGGPFWSITRYKDILEVDSNHKAFSSDNALTIDETILRGPTEDSTAITSFIAMDPPKHDTQRKIVSPAVAPTNLARLESLMRERTQGVLNDLPVGEEFDWVERVAIKLTLLMLATLMDFPLDQMGKLKRWSDVVSGVPGDGIIESWEQRDGELKEMAMAFIALLQERKSTPEAPNLVSMLAHSPHAAEMTIEEYVGNIGLLIVGGNDTTRNSMSASILAFDKHPDQWAKLMANPELVDSTVPEIIRWHTPVLYQGRRATQDYEIGGKTIRKGDKVAMWYISGNRDETAIADPENFIIDRERPRQHLSFGFGIHRCLGNRLAEMQLRVLWEEIIKKGWKRIEVTGPAVYAKSAQLRGIDYLPVRIHA